MDFNNLIASLPLVAEVIRNNGTWLGLLMILSKYKFSISITISNS